jgi:hypothetical protein
MAKRPLVGLGPGYRNIRAELDRHATDPEVLADLGYDVTEDGAYAVPPGYVENVLGRSDDEAVEVPGEEEPLPEPPPEVVDPEHIVEVDDDDRPIAPVLDITTDVPQPGTPEEREESVRRHPSSETEGTK